MSDKDLVKVLKALANERRLSILRLIYKNKQFSVTGLSEIMDMPFRSVSKHLSVLSSVDLISGEQKSWNKFYSINKEKFPKEFLIFLQS